MSKIWISHTGLNNFKNCQRSYYYNHLYRNPKTGKKIQIVSPYLSLGSAVHEAIEEGKGEDLLKRFEKIWKKYQGKKGGFAYKKQEEHFKKRGVKMIKVAQKSQVFKNPNFDVTDSLPKMPLFKDVFLVGSIDWAEILPDKSLHIIDFKTGKNKEKEASLQLFIYYLLASYNYKKKIKKTSYWYLAKDKEPTPKKITDIEKKLNSLKKQALQIKKAVLKNDFSCTSPYNNCYSCSQFDKIFSGEAEYVGCDERMNKELYYLVKKKDVVDKVLEENFLTEKEKELFQERIDGKKVLGKEKIKKKLKENLSNKELKALITCFKK